MNLLELTPQDWEWLTTNMKPFLAIDRLSYHDELTRSSGDWKKFIAYTPRDKKARKWFSMSTSDFRKNNWKKGSDRAASSRNT